MDTSLQCMMGTKMRENAQYDVRVHQSGLGFAACPPFCCMCRYSIPPPQIYAVLLIPNRLGAEENIFRKDMSVYVWGSNRFGELGITSDGSKNEPCLVDSFSEVAMAIETACG